MSHTRHRRSLLVSALASLVAVAAACSSAGSGDSRSPDGGPSPDAADGNAVNSDGASDAAGDAAKDEAGRDAEAGVVYEAGATVCKPTMSIVAPSRLAASTDVDDRFGSVTPDELSIVWTVPDGTIRYADRTVATDPFGPTQTIAGTFAVDRTAVSPSGLHVIAVAADRKGFVLLERASTADAFASTDPAVFAALVSALAPAENIGDPVLAFGEQVLIYSVYGGASTDTVRYATRLGASSPWSVAGVLAFPELRAQGTARRRPTGAGSDFQTLFFWDEVSSSEKIGQLEGTIGFFSVHDLGAHPWASPNEACTRIYYTAPGAGGLDLWVGDSN